MTNAVYDFKPANLELLTLSRFDFLLKKQRIFNFIKSAAKERNEEI
jgi:hypothetical protein